MAPESELTEKDVQEAEGLMELAIADMVKLCGGDFRWRAKSEVSVRRYLRCCTIRMVVEVTEMPDPDPDSRLRFVEMYASDRTFEPGRYWKVSKVFDRQTQSARRDSSFHLEMVSLRVEIFEGIRKVLGRET